MSDPRLDIHDERADGRGNLLAATACPSQAAATDALNAILGRRLVGKIGADGDDDVIGACRRKAGGLRRAVAGVAGVPVERERHLCGLASRPGRSADHLPIVSSSGLSITFGSPGTTRPWIRTRAPIAPCQHSEQHTTSRPWSSINKLLRRYPRSRIERTCNSTSNRSKHHRQVTLSFSAMAAAICSILSWVGCSGPRSCVSFLKNICPELVIGSLIPFSLPTIPSRFTDASIKPWRAYQLTLLHGRRSGLIIISIPGVQPCSMTFWSFLCAARISNSDRH